MKILVADDAACNRLILQDMLSGAGHEVVVAEDGLAAWALLQQPDAPKLHPGTARTGQAGSTVITVCPILILSPFFTHWAVMMRRPFR